MPGGRAPHQGGRATTPLGTDGLGSNPRASNAHGADAAIMLASLGDAQSGQMP